jgi:hypothetical protein
MSDSGLTSSQMVNDLMRERLLTEPRASHLAATDPMFVAALAWMRSTLEAVVDSCRADGWSVTETATCVRGALSRLIRDDLLSIAEERGRVSEEGRVHW